MAFVYQVPPGNEQRLIFDGADIGELVMDCKLAMSSDVTDFKGSSGVPMRRIRTISNVGPFTFTLGGDPDVSAKIFNAYLASPATVFAWDWQVFGPTSTHHLTWSGPISKCDPSAKSNDVVQLDVECEVLDLVVV